MKLHPGSFPWLAAHEARLAWRAVSFNRLVSNRVSAVLSVLFVATFVATFLHAFAWIVVHVLPHAAPRGARAEAIMGLLGLSLLITLTPIALLRSVAVLFERADLDLLLASPLRPGNVLLVRLLVIAWPLLFGLAVLLLPLVNMGLVMGRPWLGVVYAWLPILVVLVSALGVSLCMALVRRIGARRTRVLIQWLTMPAVFGFYAATNYFSTRRVGAEQLQPLLAVLGVEAPQTVTSLTLRAVGRFFLGDPPALAAALVVAAGMCALVWGALGQVFLRGSQEAMTGRRPAVRPLSRAARLRSGAGLTFTVWRKEWRSLRRDTAQLARIVQSLAFAAPAVFLIGSEASPGLVGLVAAMLTLTVSALAGQLAAATVNLDEAPDLLTASPRPLARLLRAKAGAAALPAFGVVALIVLALLPWSGPILLWTLPFAVGAAASAALTVAANPRPVPRPAFLGRRQALFDVQRTIVLLITGLLWSLAAGLMAAGIGWWGLIPTLLALPHLRTEWGVLHALDAHAYLMEGK